MNTVYAGLSEDGKKVDIYFSYDRPTYLAVKSVTGTSFVPKEKGGPYWTMPLDYAAIAELKRACDGHLEIEDKLMAWGRKEKARANQLQLLSSAQEADIPRVQEMLPDLGGWLRPYQTAGAAFIAAGDGVLIADQPGLGKTAQVIAGIYEAGLDAGAHLVIAPIVSLESVWQRELERWQPHPVWVPQGNREQREAVVEDFYNYVTDLQEPAWLVVNPQMVAFRREAPTCSTCGTAMKKVRGDAYRCEECLELGKGTLVQAFSRIGEINWTTVTVDECHKNAIRNPKTLTAQAMFKLEAKKRIAMSGTPIANKPIDLWGVLHFLHPDKFSSKWRWAGQWLEITDNGYGKVIGGLLEHRKEDFFRSLTPYVLRRTKAEVLTELPPKQVVDIWVGMTPGQRKQYLQFAEAAQLKIDEEDLTATEVLTEYLRLKQFASFKQELRRDMIKGEEKVRPYPLPDGGKLEAVWELLEERGITDADGDEKVVIFSQFERVVDMLMEWLASKDIPAMKLAGAQNRKKGESQRIQDAFQAEGGPRVLVMTTQTGGVSITLDRADSCIFIDETWLASEMEQAEDRLHRASRMHNVTVYTVRTRGSIDEYIFEVVYEKGATAEEIMDGRRKLRLY